MKFINTKIFTLKFMRHLKFDIMQVQYMHRKTGLSNQVKMTKHVTSVRK